ncbi:hypothetical protein GXW83_08185 [Streptacidiphilus sp. PB12-B1b]|uniref:hypothetical protein n=1 Tax=Streptacidiphilus sp. PB12-B1b TaxID=2705012 RepID=UPI0015F97B82|nr:hypothetical protein [Streptacidiphilus sp. PB12-B1b]QMU75721.1 hypothetical protein GXW83_08185 [Streptacidiphilus sp. PB12-B1b]
MTRDELIVMLSGDTTVHAMARAALAEGDFIIWDGLVPAAELAGTYKARLHHTLRRGQKTLALSEAVDTLKGAEDALIRIGRIDTTDQTWVFMLFLDATATTLLACTGVLRTAPEKPDISAR